MIAPTTKEIREWSKVEFEGLEFGEEEPDPLDLLVERAKEYVENVTGQTYADMPVNLEATAAEALQRRVEQLAFKSQEGEVETGADFELIQSFSAGSYSETRRAMKELLEAKMINAWPYLNDLLRRLLTPEKEEWWLVLWGVLVPAYGITEVDWHGVLLIPPITAAGDY